MTGKDERVLWISNFLIRHRDLREYMNFFQLGNSITFHHFYAVLTKEMNDLVNEDFRKVCSDGNIVALLQPKPRHHCLGWDIVGVSVSQ